MTESWTRAFEEWPLGVQPHFVTYEDLFLESGPNPDLLNEIVQRLGLEKSDRWIRPYAKKQNPGSLEEKVVCTFNDNSSCLPGGHGLKSG